MTYYHSKPPQAGLYRCVIVDPPWDQGKTGKRSVRPNQGTELPYPTMTFNEIASIPINAWAADHSFLWLWATNSRSHSSGKPILLQAFELMENWGFRYSNTNQYPYYVWPEGTNKQGRQLRIYFKPVNPIPTQIESLITGSKQWHAKKQNYRINHSNLVMQLFGCGFLLGLNGPNQDRINRFMKEKFSLLESEST